MRSRDVAAEDECALRLYSNYYRRIPMLVRCLASLPSPHFERQPCGPVSSISRPRAPASFPTAPIELGIGPSDDIPFFYSCTATLT
jgi:hypothetical protein